jgi:hypothetical protein
LARILESHDDIIATERNVRNAEKDNLQGREREEKGKCKTKQKEMEEKTGVLVRTWRKFDISLLSDVVGDKGEEADDDDEEDEDDDEEEEEEEEEEDDEEGEEEELPNRLDKEADKRSFSRVSRSRQYKALYKHS